MKTFFYKNATAIINHYLRLDPSSFQMLKKLDGQILKLNITEPRCCFIILFTEAGIKLLHTYEGPVEITITAPLTQLLKLKISQDSNTWNGIEIEGNIELAQSIYNIFKKMDIDWEEWLSKGIGDIPAHHFGNAFRAARAWSQKTRHSFGNNIREHLQFDGGFLVSRKEVSDFQNDVIALRNDVDRLEARLRILMESSHLCEK